MTRALWEVMQCSPPETHRVIPDVTGQTPLKQEKLRINQEAASENIRDLLSGAWKSGLGRNDKQRPMNSPSPCHTSYIIWNAPDPGGLILPGKAKPS